MSGKKMKKNLTLLKSYYIYVTTGNNLDDDDFIIV